MQQLERKGHIEVFQVRLPLRRSAGTPPSPTSRASPTASRIFASAVADVGRVAGVGSREPHGLLCAVAGGRALSRAGRREAPRPSSDGRWRPRDSRRSHARSRTPARPASPRSLAGYANRGLAARDRTSAGSSDRSARSKPIPQTRPPSYSGLSAQMYQSGCSRNHGCSIDVWHGTTSMKHAQPARLRRRQRGLSNSWSEPNSGSMPL